LTPSPRETNLFPSVATICVSFVLVRELSSQQDFHGRRRVSVTFRPRDLENLNISDWSLSVCKVWRRLLSLFHLIKLRLATNELATAAGPIVC